MCGLLSNSSNLFICRFFSRYKNSINWINHIVEFIYFISLLNIEIFLIVFSSKIFNWKVSPYI